MMFQLEALQRQRDQALFQQVLAEAKVGMLEIEREALRKLLKDATDATQNLLTKENGQGTDGGVLS